MGSIDLHRTQGVARIVVNDPERHNAMTVSMWRDLRAAVQEIDEDRDIRVCVLRGQGDRAFVSGANISEFDRERDSPEAVARYNSLVEQAQGSLSRCRVPVIAAISGVCFGGGLGLALACDLRYASAHARFRMPAARLGLGYAFEGMRQFVQQIGPQAAAEAFYSARIYDAQGAAQLGIVRAVVDDVFAYTDALAQEIAGNAPLTVQAAKLAMRTALRPDHGPAELEHVQAAISACFASQDYAEGRQAFAQKRPARFVGR